MNDLCTRARAALNVILLLSLLQAWVVFTDRDGGSITDRLVVVQDQLRLLDERSLPDSLKKLQKAIETPSTLAANARRQWHRRVSLAALTAPSNSDVADIELVIREQQTPMSGAEIIIRRRNADRDGDLVTVRAMAAAKLATELGVLQDLITTTNLPDTATVGDLERSRFREIEIPFLNEKVEARVAWRLLILGTFSATLLLAAIASSLLTMMRIDQSVKFLDLLFLYPSKLGYILGIGWVLAPVLMVLLGIVNGVTIGLATSARLDSAASIFVLLLFAVLAFVVISLATRVRTQLMLRHRC